MSRVITARRADTCRAETCSQPARDIAAGQRINYGGPGAVTHEQCEAVEAQSSRRSGPRYGRGRYAYTSTGARMSNRYGRCEDAPCCGCCD